MGTQEQMAAIYAKLHANRYEHVEQARRARDMQAELVKSRQALWEEKESFRYLQKIHMIGFESMERRIEDMQTELNSWKSGPI